ncbi:MAG: hypothetical protein JNN01_03110 [Opitutaceae bacterium]|nr:hypothetical protein [Opitutaceae bacterium]
MARPSAFITPSQQAVNGALDAFVAGSRKSDLRAQQVGLTVLGSATESQVVLALKVLEERGVATELEIRALLSA